MARFLSFPLVTRDGLLPNFDGNLLRISFDAFDNGCDDADFVGGIEPTVSGATGGFSIGRCSAAGFAASSGAGAMKPCVGVAEATGIGAVTPSSRAAFAATSGSTGGNTGAVGVGVTSAIGGIGWRKAPGGVLASGAGAEGAAGAGIGCKKAPGGTLAAGDGLPSGIRRSAGNEKRDEGSTRGAVEGSEDFASLPSLGLKTAWAGLATRINAAAAEARAVVQSGHPL